MPVRSPLANTSAATAPRVCSACESPAVVHRPRAGDRACRLCKSGGRGQPGSVSHRHGGVCPVRHGGSSEGFFFMQTSLAAEKSRASGQAGGPCKPGKRAASSSSQCSPRATWRGLSVESHALLLKPHHNHKLHPRRRLSQRVLRDDRLAATAAVLFVLNPSAPFQTAPYSESLYACVTLVGLWALYCARSGALAAAAFACSTALRSNGGPRQRARRASRPLSATVVGALPGWLAGPQGRRRVTSPWLPTSAWPPPTTRTTRAAECGLPPARVRQARSGGLALWPQGARRQRSAMIPWPN